MVVLPIVPKINVLRMTTQQPVDNNTLLVVGINASLHFQICMG
jgi:hypothetical protein